MRDTFNLLDGKVSVSNSEIRTEINHYSKNEFIYHGKRFLLGVIAIFVYNRFLKDRLNETLIWQYIKEGFGYFGLLILGVIIIYLIFFHKWGKNLQINDLKKIEISSGKNSVDITLNMSNSRFTILEFDPGENDYQDFIEVLKKRNTRVIIKDER